MIQSSDRWKDTVEFANASAHREYNIIEEGREHDRYKPEHHRSALHLPWERLEAPQQRRC